MTPGIVRTVIPNTSGAFVLRVGLDSTRKLSIVAWLVQTNIDHPADPWSGRTTWVEPIVVDEKCDDELDCVVDGDDITCGVLGFAGLTRDEAINACRARLRERERTS